MPVDQRNLNELRNPDKRYLRTPAETIQAFSTCQVRFNDYADDDDPETKANGEWLLSWLREMDERLVARDGEGRKELVMAIQSEQQGFRPLKIGEQGQGTTVVVNGANGHKPTQPVKERPKIWERLNQGLK